MNDYSLLLSAAHDDLRKLVAAQESFFADNVRYAASLDLLNFHPSAGVTLTILGATAKTWSATATHSQLPELRCAIFVGDVPTGSRLAA